MEKKIFALYRIEWTEHERGWGCRPDGETYHCSLKDANKYIDDYWAKMPSGPAPDEYSAPGTPTLVEVTEELYNKVMKIVKPPEPPENAIKRTFDNIKEEYVWPHLKELHEAVGAKETDEIIAIEKYLGNQYPCKVCGSKNLQVHMAYCIKCENGHSVQQWHSTLHEAVGAWALEGAIE